MIKQALKLSKGGTLLGGIGIILGVVIILMLVVIPKFGEVRGYEANVRSPAFIEFLLAISHTIRLYAAVAECIALAFLFMGFANIYCARMRQNCSKG